MLGYVIKNVDPAGITFIALYVIMYSEGLFRIKFAYVSVPVAAAGALFMIPPTSTPV